MYKILIADDDEFNLEIMIQHLNNSGEDFQIFQAHNGSIAIAKAKEILPDIIIMDWDMPEMNGVEAIKNLKAEKNTKEIPIIMATAIMTSSVNLKESFQAGAFDYVRKPVDELELITRIKSAIQISEGHKKLNATNAELKKHKKELETANQELHAINEQLTETNEQLIIVNRKLNLTYNKLKESENRYRQLNSATFEGIIIHKDGFILESNPAIENLLGFTTYELQGKSFLDFIPEYLKEQFKKLLHTESCTSETLIIDSKGKKIDIEFYSQPFEFENQETKVLAIRDITSKKIFETIEKQRFIEKIETEKKINTLLKAKFVGEISHKNRELATSTVYLLGKNEVLNEIKAHITNLISSKSDISESFFKPITKLINDNISLDTDWNQFRIHFDQVHPNFFVKLQEKCPDISQTDMKHCSFIKMGFSTKEIARLLNIGARSVQISRYRLKKKLMLEKDNDIYEFIKNL